MRKSPGSEDRAQRSARGLQLLTRNLLYPAFVLQPVNCDVNGTETQQDTFGCVREKVVIFPE